MVFSIYLHYKINPLHTIIMLVYVGKFGLLESCYVWCYITGKITRAAFCIKNSQQSLFVKIKEKNIRMRFDKIETFLMMASRQVLLHYHIIITVIAYLTKQVNIQFDHLKCSNVVV